MLAQDFLACARRYASASSEGDWRSAISRAYYAIFHHFREWFRLRGLKIGNGAQAHSNLHFGLANCGILGTQQVAQKIDHLRSDRINADYDLWRVIDSQSALSAVNDANAILTDFQLLLQTTPPQQIADGAKNYLISIGRITP